ncbi:MAG: hypothetical protein KDA53_12720 [Hyphomonas sp.]|nr:hypothetical protein [Hyphomonas sp.]
MALAKSFQLPGFAPAFLPSARPAAAPATQAGAGLGSDLAQLLAPFKRPRGNMADAAGLLGGLLMDLDGTMGAGNMQAAHGRWQDHVADAREEHAQAQQQEILKRAALGDDLAMALMDPIGNRAFKRAGDWRTEDIGRADTIRKEDIGRADAAIEREEGWRLKDYVHTLTQAGRAQDNWDKAFEEDQRQFGITSDLARQDQELDQLKALLAAEGSAVTDEGALRREYLAQNKDFLDMQRSIGKIRGLDTSTAPGQMGLIFNLMKLYDPGSTVREGEFANAENARGVPASVQNAWNKMLDGAFLTEEQITQFRATADGLYDSALGDYDRSFRSYRDDIAPGYGFDPGRSVPDLRDPQMLLGSFSTGAGLSVPAGAVEELLGNRSRAEMAEFDATFGDGMAEQILAELGFDIPAVPAPVEPRKYEVPR